MGWGSTSDPRFLPAMLITGAMVLAALAFFVPMWIKSSKTGDQLKVLAEGEGWTWADSAPADLREALNRIYVKRHWAPRKVMVARSSSGDAYLFHFEARQGSGGASTGSSTTSQKGIACLIVGRTGPNAPIYSIVGWPPGKARLLVGMKADLLDSVGGPAFRERYYVESAGYTGYTDDDQTELEAVRIPPALEEELLGWEGPTAEGLPDGWSGATIRDQLVMVYWNSRDDISAGAWRGLLSKAEKISQILKKD